MTSLDQQAQQTQAKQQQAGGGGGALGPPQAPAPPQVPQETPAQGLPPTGIDQQLATINQEQQQPQAMGASLLPGAAPPTPPGQGQGQIGSTNVQQMAQNLARQYGLAIGRGNIVDAQGNFLQTPEQMAQAGGRGQGGYSPVAEAANKMSMISDALTRQMNEQQQQKGIAAIQTGLGQVQSRARGSLASLQTGLYQDLADLYSNQEYEAADFSYFIQREQFELAQHQMHRERKKGKKRGRLGVFSGLAQMGIGMATQNYGLIGKGVTGALGSAAETGWF